MEIGDLNPHKMGLVTEHFGLAVCQVAVRKPPKFEKSFREYV